MHEILPTRTFLIKRHVNISPLCPLCNSSAETVEHLFLKCTITQNLWDSLSRTAEFQITRNHPFKTWIKENLTLKVFINRPRIPWYLIFAYMLRNIWLARKELIFRNVYVLNSVIHKSMVQAAEFFATAIHLKSIGGPVVKAIKWEPPDLGWFKLNTDGSSLGNPGPAGSGALIRDHLGNWIAGLHRFIGHGTNMLAELHALRDGLTLAKRKNIQKLIVELDAKVVIDTIQNNESNPTIYDTLIVDCRSLLNQFESYKMVHVYREGNKSADCLARRGSKSGVSETWAFGNISEDLVIYESIPDFLLDICKAEAIGTANIRLV